MKHYIPWVLMFAAAEAVLTLLQFACRKRTIKKGWRAALIAAKALGAIACAALVLGGPVALRPVQIPMVAVYAALLPDAAADALYAAFCALKKKQRAFAPVKILSLVLGVAFFVFGTVNMQTVRPVYREYRSAKLSHTYTVAFAADMHVGSAQSMETTEKTIAAMKAENPDFVILGGDITDDYTTKEEMERTYRLFGEMGVPVYFIFGNHEVVQHAEYMKDGRLHYTEEELVQTMKDNGITVVADAYVTLGDDLLLLGREDAAATALRKDIGDLANPDPAKFLLVADHQPTKAKDNLTAGTDLQLSGHTHAGQLFPCGLMMSLVSYNCGNYDLGNGANLYVSAGACGWRAPFRTESGCHFEMVTLGPEE